MVVWSQVGKSPILSIRKVPVPVNLPHEELSYQQKPASAEEGTAPSRTDVREFFRLFNRRKMQMFGVTALVVILTGVVLTQLTPEYRSTALLMLDTRRMKVTNVSDVVGGLMMGGTTELAAIQTEIEVLRSVSLLGRVADKLHLESDPEFGGSRTGTVRSLVRYVRGQVARLEGQPVEKGTYQGDESPRARAVGALARNLTIAPRGRSYVIAVSMDSVDPAKAQKITEAITDYYIVDQLDAKLDANKRATDWLNERLSELKRNVDAAERAVASFRERTGLTLSKDTTVFAQSLTELNSQLIQARAQRADRESRLVALEQGQKNPAALGGITEVLANSLISALRAQEAEVARRIGDLNQRYGDSHPRLLQARSEQGQIQSRINAEVAKIISAVRADAEAARAKEQELQAQVSEFERRAGGIGQSETEVKQLEREAVTTRTVYEDFLKRFKELREQQDIQQPDARVLSPATFPGSPNFPRYSITLGVAGVIGLLMGVGVVLLMERLDGGFRTGDQIERLMGYPAIGMIPLLSRLSLGKQTPARLVIEKPGSAYGESLRSVFTAMTLGSLDRPPKVVMVTSALPDEGKSTFTASMAGLMAKSSPEKKIILVDCDLRRSSISDKLGVERADATLDEYLSGARPLSEVVQLEPQSGLHFISARADTPNSAEILGSNAMRRFISALADSYDVVFLDTPPVMAVSDARVVAQLADYIIFLVRWERTPRELAVNAVRLLRDLRKHVGVVLSQVNVRRHARYGYGDYGYYYSKYRSYYTK